MVDDKQWSNVIIGPWTPKETLKGGKTRDQIITEEMAIVDSLSEKVMVQLIQTLKDNEVNISTKDFYRMKLLKLCYLKSWVMNIHFQILCNT